MSKRILFAVATIALAAAGIFYRAASTHTSRLQADEIVQADTAGADVKTRLVTLQAFVNTHMGSSVSLTLKSSYDRAQAAATAAATVPAADNSKIYADAQKACAGKSDSITQAKCNQAYLAQHLAAAATPAPPVPAPKLSDYQYAYNAPLWTPDLAGALLLGALVAAVFGLILGKQKGTRR